jgi:hypothetical protein
MLAAAELMEATAGFTWQWRALPRPGAVLTCCPSRRMARGGGPRVAASFHADRGEGDIDELVAKIERRAMAKKLRCITSSCTRAHTISFSCPHFGFCSFAYPAARAFDLPGVTCRRTAGVFLQKTPASIFTL